MAHVTTEDAVWATVHCSECKLNHKVSKRHMPYDYNCPYCKAAIFLSDIHIHYACERAAGRRT